MLVGCSEKPDDPENGGGSNVDGSGKYTGKSVTIGSQTWMAENLNRAFGNSKCYDDSSSYCAKYGRLYNWGDAKNACPSGWHLPTIAEWDTLMVAVGDSSTAGTKLKSKSGWNNNGNGTDNYGFSALPGGSGGSVLFGYAGDKGNWWSATENDNVAFYLLMSYDYEYVDKSYKFKTGMFSVRCVKD